jgi:hypothetical protein
LGQRTPTSVVIFSVCDAVTWHHDPLGSSDRSFGPLACVHAANVWTHDNDEAGGGRLKYEYYEALGLAARVPEWHRACVENFFGGVGA